MLPLPATARRAPLPVISIPGTSQPAAVFRHQLRPSGKVFLKYLPWIAGSTIVLWLFVLRAHNPPPGSHPPSWHPYAHPVPPYGTRPPWGRPTQQHPPQPPAHEGGSWKWGMGNSQEKPPGIWDTRAEQVKEAYVHAFEGYKRYADGYDELLPIAGGSVNNFNGWGVTLFDSLDTMWIMGLHNLFRESLKTVAQTDFYLPPGKFAPFFETTIRYLGGLLSAYALSGEPILLTRADDLGRMLLPAFDGTSGLPMAAVNTKNGQTQKGWSGDVLWAEALSNQMEYKYLAHITGRKEYFIKTERAMEKMYNLTLSKGLFPSKWSSSSGEPANQHYTVGAFADSAYEYMLKQWLLTGRSEPLPLELYLNSTNAILENLLFLTPERNLLYVTDLTGDDPSHTLEHLSCFLPGLLALGVHTLPDESLPAKTKERHLWAAQGLAETCWVTYADTKTGLGADEVRMTAWPQPDTASTQSEDGEKNIGGAWLRHVERWERVGRPHGKPPGARTVTKETDPSKREWRTLKDAYLLRPETIESFYVLWKTTGDVKWRERGWAIFESIDRHTRTKTGYSSIAHVDAVPPQWRDEMPSYFLAETLKYLYLLFIDEDLIPFEDWVLNTEAHPLPIFDWTPWEKIAYGIVNSTGSASNPDTSTATTSTSPSP